MASFFDDIGTFINRTLGTEGGLLSDIGVQPFKVPAPVEDILGGAAALGGAALALPAILPAISAGAGDIGTALGLGSGGLGTAAAGAPLDISAAANAPLDLSTIGAGVDTTGAALPGGLDTTLATGADLTSPATTASLFPVGNASTLAGSAGTASNVASGVGNVAAGAGNAATGAGNFISDLTSGNFFNALQSGGADIKAVAPYAGLGGLGYNLYQGYETNQANKALTAQEAATAQTAANLSSQEQAAAQPLLNSGEALTQYIQTGTLPQAFQTQVNQQVAAAKAAIVQGYATRGMSTNPSQNSQLAADLANVDANAQNLTASLESTLNTAGQQLVTTANGLLSSGLSATEFSAELPLKVSALNQSLNQSISSSIANFAAALNGGLKVNTTLPQNIVNPTGTLNV